MSRLGRAQPFKPLVQQRNFGLTVKGITLTETITGTEALNRGPARSLTEAITGTEAISLSKVTLITLTETTTMTEAAVSFATSAFIRSLTEVIVATEIFSISGLWTPRSKTPTSWTIRPRT